MKDERKPKRDEHSEESSDTLTDHTVWDDSEDGYAVILTGVPPSGKLRGKPGKAKLKKAKPKK